MRRRYVWPKTLPRGHVSLIRLMELREIYATNENRFGLREWVSRPTTRGCTPTDTVCVQREPTQVFPLLLCCGPCVIPTFKRRCDFTFTQTPTHSAPFRNHYSVVNDYKILDRSILW
jgi:hypothetical protein